MDETSGALATGVGRGRSARESDALLRENRMLQQAIAILQSSLENERAEAAAGRERLQLMREVNEHLVLEKLKAVDARDAADAGLERQNVFLSILAHELRNPMASIAVANAVMSTMPDTPLRMKKMVAIVGRQAAHLLRLVDDLLDASRITTGKISLRVSPIALDDIVECALDTAQPFLAQRSQQLEISLPPVAVRLDGDMVRLAQLLSNLIINASKFSAPGQTIHLMAQVCPPFLTIVVSDAGKGIALENQAHIFDLFSQGPDEGEQSLSGGLGIGLSLVRAIAEMHGGSVRVDSAGAGCGSAFSVRLPLPVITLIPL